MRFKSLDRVLLSLAAALCVTGLILIYSATSSQPELHSLPWKQALWVTVGTGALLLTTALDYQGVINKGFTLYWISVGLLALLLALARRSSYGAARWFNFHFFYFQPADLAKLALILVLAQYLSLRASDLRRFRSLWLPLGLMALMMILILRQPDLGTALVLLPITFCMLYVAGARFWHLATLAASLGGMVPLLWPFLKEYQRNRVLTFLDPSRDALGAGYNAIQSQIAAGSGGWFGQGYMKGTQSQLHFVPFHHTDFVFSVMAEEGGLLGCLILFGLLLGLLARLAHIGARARYLSGTLLCTGLIGWLGAQTVINIGMTLGVMPVTGLPLPLVSYGGSSTLATLIGLGLALSVYKETQ
jgi:rod shape determining protein RodA